MSLDKDWIELIGRARNAGISKFRIRRFIKRKSIQNKLGRLLYGKNLRK